MNARPLVPLALLLAACADAPPAPAQSSTLSEAEFAARVAPHLRGWEEGCFVLRDLRTGETRRWSPEECAERTSPASTFKIPNTLIGLQTGVIDPERVERWDSTPQRIDAWERDHDLASAFANSVVWYYQRAARRVGPERMSAWVERLGYGNRDTSAGVAEFWLEPRGLRISPDEQVEFLERLARGGLPFDAEHLATLRRIMVARETDGAVLRGKTGTGPTADGRLLGWYVGTVEREYGGPWVFAVRIEGEEASGFRARDLANALLADLGVMPAEEEDG